MPALDSRASAQSAYRKYIPVRDDRSRPIPATGSRARTLRAAMRHNRTTCGRRSRPAATRAGPERKNKTETISADVRSYLELRQPIADDREWNRASRYRLED